MRLRLFFIVTLLVIVPTGLLSMLAGRALRSREVMLKNELETRAANAIDVAASRLRTRIEDDLEHIRATLQETTSRGGKYREVETAVARLIGSRDLVSEIYLFLHPWGMMYPQGGDDESPIRLPSVASAKEGPFADSSTRLRPGWDFLPTEGWPEEHEALVEALRAGVTADTRRRDVIRFRVADVSYCFAPLESGRPMHAGYAINEDALLNLLRETTRTVSGDDFLLIYDFPGRKSEIIVQDSFGQLAHSPIHPLAHSPSGALASSSLLAPFSHIEITAYLKDPEGLAASERFYSRLFGWGIALLAAGICVGMWIVLQQSAAEIRRARARSDFVVGVSHDLKTPISSVKVMAESLAMKRVESQEKQQLFHRTIARECDRLADMVERVLFFMREEQGAAVYRSEPIDIASLVAQGVGDFRDRHRDDIAIDLKIAQDLPEVKGDADALAKVLFNLLDNAMKYSAAAEEKTMEAPTIGVSVDKVAGRGREWIRVAVTDSGVGIDERELKKVFRKFYRASLESTGKVGGIGLGLAICDRIARAHKGRIEAHSMVGEGSTFTIVLPAIG